MHQSVLHQQVLSEFLMGKTPNLEKGVKGNSQQDKRHKQIYLLPHLELYSCFLTHSVYILLLLPLDRQSEMYALY